MAKNTRKLPNLDQQSAAQAIDAQAPAQESGVFAQPNVAAPDSNSVTRVNFRPANTFETREAWLDAFCAALVKFFKENGDNVTENAMVSIGQPSAKRAKDEKGQVLLKGKIAFTYSPNLSTNGRFQIFIAAQLNHDEDLALALGGQLLRTAVWNDEKDTPNGYSKKAKDLFAKYGLSADVSTGSIACIPSSKLLHFVMAKITEFGPSPYAKIDLVAKDLTQRTATRSAKIFCADANCACRKTDTAKNAKRNKDGGFSLQVSDGWIIDKLKASGTAIPEDLENPATTLTGVNCWFGDSPLKFTWSEFRIEKLKEKATGEKSEMK